MHHLSSEWTCFTVGRKAVHTASRSRLLLSSTQKRMLSCCDTYDQHAWYIWLWALHCHICSCPLRGNWPNHTRVLSTADAQAPYHLYWIKKDIPTAKQCRALIKPVKPESYDIYCIIMQNALRGAGHNWMIDNMFQMSQVVPWHYAWYKVIGCKDLSNNLDNDELTRSRRPP